MFNKFQSSHFSLLLGPVIVIVISKLLKRRSKAKRKAPVIHECCVKSEEL